MDLEMPASHTHMWLRDNGMRWTVCTCVCVCVCVWLITEIMLFLPQEENYTQDLTADKLCSSLCFRVELRSHLSHSDFQRSVNASIMSLRILGPILTIYGA